MFGELDRSQVGRTKAFMNAMKFSGPWDGTIEQALPIMDKAGTMIMPLIADAVLLADRMEEQAKRGGKPDRDRPYRTTRCRAIRLQQLGSGSLPTI